MVDTETIFLIFPDPFDVIRKSCDLIKKANYDIKWKLFDTGFYNNQEHALQWLVYCDSTDDLLKEIESNSLQLFNESTSADCYHALFKNGI